MNKYQYNIKVTFLTHQQAFAFQTTAEKEFKLMLNCKYTDLDLSAVNK
jgi:hypothetical protein